MPNIEIHGLGGREAHDLRLRIFFAFKNEEYVNEMVVTVFPTQVFDITGKAQPFLRLVNDCQRYTKRIIEKLKEFGLDIEHVRLERFYPKASASKCALKKASYPPVEQLRGRTLGRILIKIGLLTKEQLHECLRMQQAEKKPRKIGQIFLELGLVNKQQLRYALDSQK